jgi:hypothetical protein
MEISNHTAPDMNTHLQPKSLTEWLLKNVENDEFWTSSGTYRFERNADGSAYMAWKNSNILDCSKWILIPHLIMTKSTNHRWIILEFYPNII